MAIASQCEGEGRAGGEEKETEHAECKEEGKWDTEGVPERDEGLSPVQGVCVCARVSVCVLNVFVCLSAYL